MVSSCRYCVKWCTHAGSLTPILLANLLDCTEVLAKGHSRSIRNQRKSRVRPHVIPCLTRFSTHGRVESEPYVLLRCCVSRGTLCFSPVTALSDALSRPEARSFCHISDSVTCSMVVLTELQTCCDASSHQAWTQSNSRVRHQCHKSCLTGGSSSARPGFQARRHEVGSHSQGVHADDHTVVSQNSFFSSESNILICPPQQTSCVCVAINAQLKSNPPRNGKSCRLRWYNQLCPDIKKGPFTPEEVCDWFSSIFVCGLCYVYPCS